MMYVHTVREALGLEPGAPDAEVERGLRRTLRLLRRQLNVCLGESMAAFAH